jgi:hypothetical protein
MNSVPGLTIPIFTLRDFAEMTRSRYVRTWIFHPFWKPEIDKTEAWKGLDIRYDNKMRVGQILGVPAPLAGETDLEWARSWVYLEIQS